MKAVSRKSAPSVVYPVRRSAALAWIIGVILLAAAAAITLWALSDRTAHAGRYAWVWLAAAAWVLAAMGALHFWLHQFRGDLVWDGAGWLLQSAGAGQYDRRSGALKGRPQPLIDLQSHLWVALTAADHQRIWIWLERAHDPQRWIDLRRAVYSRAASGSADELTRQAAVDRES
ncbi:MAG: hypothetical protein ACK5OA_06160 [Acidovorax sp.]